MFASPADISWGLTTLVQPNLFVVPPEQLSRRWSSVTHLVLAVEIVSPSSVRTDRWRKRMLYMRRGVETYWIVDPDAQLVEVWRPGDERPAIVGDTLRWRVTEGAPELHVDAVALFASLPHD